MGNPNDIAPIVSFLLSDDSKYISGQNIAVDGGWTAKGMRWRDQMFCLLELILSEETNVLEKTNQNPKEL